MNSSTPLSREASYPDALWAVLCALLLADALRLWNEAAPSTACYLTVLLSAMLFNVALQRTLQHRHQNVPGTHAAYGWVRSALAVCVMVGCLGPWQAALGLPSLGAYALSALVAVIAAVIARDIDETLSAERPRQALERLLGEPPAS